MTGDDAALTGEVARLLYREAYFLDRRRWREWLELYADDAVYWVPAFASDDEMTTDPDNEVSLIYLDRAGLEARVFRIEGGDSLANEPLPWTAHLVANVLAERRADGLVEATATWLVHSFAGLRGPVTRGGLYEYLLRRAGGRLEIARKKILLYDDRIEGPIDVYNV